MRKKRYSRNFPVIEYGKNSLDEIKEIVAKNGGVYIEGLCMIRSVERATTKNVDGIFKKGNDRHMTTHILFAGEREFSSGVKEKMKK